MNALLFIRSQNREPLDKRKHQGVLSSNRNSTLLRDIQRLRTSITTSIAFLSPRKEGDVNCIGIAEARRINHLLNARHMNMQTRWQEMEIPWESCLPTARLVRVWGLAEVDYLARMALKISDKIAFIIRSKRSYSGRLRLKVECILSSCEHRRGGAFA